MQHAVWLGRVWWLMLGLSLGQAARAEDMELAPSAVVQCAVSESDRAPRYPQDLLAMDVSATIEARLTFEAPDQPPRVEIPTITDESGRSEQEFANVIRRYARTFRVPCMPAGSKPVVLKQRYVFDPNDARKVMPSQLEDEADGARAAKLACKVRAPDAVSSPYPMQALQRNEQGAVYLRLTFEAPDKPPRVEVIAGVPSRALRGSAVEYAKGWRLPCLGDEAVTTTFLIKYKIDGQASPRFKPVDLGTFLGSLKKPVPPAYFDMNEMKCPFDVRIGYYQPYSANRVREIESTEPSRMALLKWLSELTLNLDREHGDAMLGNDLIVRIPCGKIDL